MLNIRNLEIKRRTKNGTEPLFSLSELTVEKGEIVTLMGPSGVGKSTLKISASAQLPRANWA